MFSTYFENNTPSSIPKNVADVPITKPTRKNIFLIEEFLTPIDLSIAISLVLFLTNIVKPEIILNAATIIIMCTTSILSFNFVTDVLIILMCIPVYYVYSLCMYECILC